MPEDRYSASISDAVRAIIVDDEKLGRQLVRNLADTSPLITIVGEYANGRDAIAAVKSTRPEVVFLDIKMPEVNGLSVAREILHSDCLVVFVTAFEAHALEAFEVQAFDYLLKPVEVARFEVVVKRIHQAVRRARLEKVLDADPSGASRVAGSPPTKAPVDTRIRIREGNTIRYVDTGKVVWFEAANQYVQVHAVSGNYLISTESLNSLQAKIDPVTFVRIHRSSIINIDYANCIRVDEHGVYFVEMSNGDRVRVSRSNRSALRDLDI